MKTSEKEHSGNPIVSEIVKDFLVKAGFDGLFSQFECACLNDDLFPCGEARSACEAGYKGPCTCDEEEGCPWDGDWHMYRDKPKGEHHES